MFKDMKMNSASVVRAIAPVMMTVLLVGCAQFPTIDTQKLQPVKSVAIVDVPSTRYVAWLGVEVHSVHHFEPENDKYFLEGPLKAGDSEQATKVGMDAANSAVASNPQTGMLGVAVAALAGALIDSSAQETITKSQSFHDEVMRRVPGLDYRRDFIASLRSALEAKGYRVSIIEDQLARSPRLRWPTGSTNEFVSRRPANPADAYPSVDADILMQVSPVAAFVAPGPLNAYTSQVSVGLALYEGRTKGFLGMETIKPDISRTSFYHRYDDLVNNTPDEMRKLREELLSTVPKIVSKLPQIRI